MPGNNSALLSNLRSAKNAGEWAIPYAAAAALSGPAYALGALKYGVPEIMKGYREGGIGQALGGLNEAARKVPIIGGPSVDMMQAAERFADKRGASGAAQFAVDFMSPDPVGKIGALAAPAAKVLGGLNLAVIPAFVGSPSKWDNHAKLGRLAPDWKRIGSGEGAQMYGYGHYSADVADTAKSYAPRRYDIEDVLMKKYDDAVSRMDYDSAEVYEAAMLHQSPQQIRNRLQAEVDMGNLTPDDLAKREPALRQIDELGGTQMVYGVLHDVNPEDLLDLDAPLKDQPWFRQVKDVVDEYNGSGKDPDAYARLIAMANANKDQTGLNFIHNLLGRFDGDPSKVSEFLREAGIPGSQYYDNLSRFGSRDFIVKWADDGKRAAVVDSQSGDLVKEFGTFKEADEWVLAQTDKRTRNYVMFQDDLTYVDPERTDPELIGGLRTDAPYRTVK